MTLIELAEKYKPSKRVHNYMPRYEQHLAPMRNDVTRMLEIGVENGSSLRMWEEYFPSAEIVGLDIDPDCTKHAGGRIKVVVGSQSDAVVLRSLGEFDVIIDDGSHRTEDQQNTFVQMFPNNLVDGGLYFIEDMEGPERHPTLEMLKRLADGVNYWPAGFRSCDWPRINHLGEHADEFTKSALAIHIYRYLACVEKGRNPEDGEAAYRLARI